MAIRIEVQPEGTIEIRTPGTRGKYLNFHDPARALIMIEFLMKREIERARGERFIPEIEKEARRAFEQLQRRSPFYVSNGKTE